MGERICSVDGCTGRVEGRGWCGRHYQRWRNHGDPLKTLRPTWDLSEEDRFWSYVDADGDCWIWMGARRSGTHPYGKFQRNDRTVEAHRWAYENLVGPIPHALTLDHLCRNPPCVNPDHLEPVTRAENTRRGISGARNRVKTHCSEGHPFSAENTRIHKGSRKCRECGRRASLAYYYANRDRAASPVGL